ncbi:PAS domain S-box-containing protein/diguanylate cyclase (GGDEF) domain-containing protein [Ralstonia sp. 25mfcol4.1]|uniref:sensor domain-containing protein n=1 Tax=Ralstonia sp. 25mfcol4.1 TaxID=1761899 RepID=UPI00088F9B8B|nr:bifunctional diguanylate cyclase/phosphodiesterase [Ralstonia sp. 25mfcol4.1]SDP68439.1 PAS domain S-box-containing protein/diguanylate cyclase (GGDEF) domain-containing protein [Ralstonia sp. 25mfcol4.1]
MAASAGDRFQPQVGAGMPLASLALEQVLLQFPEPLLLKSRRGVWLFVNTEMCQLMQRPAEELLGRSDDELFGAERAATYRAVHDRVVESGEHQEETEVFRVRDGGERILRTRKRLVRLPHSPEPLILVWITDITDAHRTAEALSESEAHYRYAVELSPEIPWTADKQGRITEAGPRWAALTGMPVAEALGDGWARCVHPDDLPRVSETWSNAVASHRGVDMEYRVKLRDGSYRWFRARAAARTDDNENVIRWYGTLEDIDDRKSASMAMEGLAARLSAVLESTTDSVVQLDHSLRLTYFNGNAARAMAGRMPALGRSVWDIFPEERDGVFAEQYRLAMTRQTPVVFEHYMQTLQAWYEIHVYPTEDGLSVFFRDVSERKDAEQQLLANQGALFHMARHDPLTGIANRLLWRERMEEILASATPHSLSALLYIDLDGFKGVNDAFGHFTGDIVLQKVAARLQACVDDSEAVARIGGDEFVVVLERAADRQAIDDLARKLIAQLARPFELNAERVTLGGCIGIALIPDDGGSADELLQAADVALYQAKAEGPNAYRYFSADEGGRTKVRFERKRALHHAVAAGQFELHYQPIYDLRSGQLRSFEALLRWRHPVHGLVSPADFVPLTEETGLIVPIGEWALSEACRQLARWPSAISVGVNLSPLQFRGRALLEAVRRAVNESGVQFSRLELEITESVLLRNDRVNLELLRELRAMGARIAMDDFGTGYSSLSYLRSFPFDKIKLDRSFVADLATSAEARAILHAVRSLGAAFRVRTTAEGIETPEQLSVVRQEGYDEGQGYLLGRPTDSEDAFALAHGVRDGESDAMRWLQPISSAPGVGR